MEKELYKMENKRSFSPLPSCYEIPGGNFLSLVSVKFLRVNECVLTLPQTPVHRYRRQCPSPWSICVLPCLHLFLNCSPKVIIIIDVYQINVKWYLALLYMALHLVKYNCLCCHQWFESLSVDIYISFLGHQCLMNFIIGCSELLVYLWMYMFLLCNICEFIQFFLWLILYGSRETT